VKSGAGVGGNGSGAQEVVLPRGWERKVNLNGNVFYVDHNTRTTHWDPPTELRHDLQLAFAMGTHARLGGRGAEGNDQGTACPYLMMPADLVERILGLACDQKAGDHGEDLAIDQGVVLSAVPAARRGPLQFELHGSIFTLPAPSTGPLNFDFVRSQRPEEHSPTTKRALSNYEAFHGLPAGYATACEVARSCAGLHGWAAWTPPRMAKELQLAFAMGTHARLGAGCPYLMMPAELVELVIQWCTIAMPRGAVARAHGLPMV